MKKSGYDLSLNDSPRRWWQITERALLECGLVPTRADRCTYILYDDTSKTKTCQPPRNVTTEQLFVSEAIDYLMDPVARNNAKGRRPHGFVCLHVDDLFMGGDKVFEHSIRFCLICIRTLRLDPRTRMRSCLLDSVSNGRHMTNMDHTCLVTKNLLLMQLKKSRLTRL